MTAYYNEIDPYAAQWLRNLIAAGHIAPGDVDERSIEDIKPCELADYAQCHFFAGIGGWSYALRQAGWPDERPVWTGSCPCQPFSAAGKGKGFADERHLWPAWFHLISQCQPRTIFSEQVAHTDGLGWLDIVQADLEATGYSSGAVDLCAAGVGAPHIRQRLWIVADSTKSNHSACVMDNAHDEGLERLGHGHHSTGGRAEQVRPITTASELGGLADDRLQQRPNGPPEICHVGPVNGFWCDADWLLCRDGKWRSVEPGSFPLAYGISARMGRLRAYGNAIVPQVAAEMIRAYLRHLILS